MMKKILLLLGLIPVAAAVAYYFVSNNNLEQKPRHSLNLLDSNCNPARSVCVAADQKHSITLHFPEQVHYLAPFKMQVTTKGISKPGIDAVNIEYTMVGMDMGLNRFSLMPLTDVKGQTLFEGEGILPVCVSGRVDWLANVEISTADMIYQAAFKLVVTKQ